MTSLLSFADVWTASQLLERTQHARSTPETTGWTIETLAGRMVELSGPAFLSAACSLVLDAQQNDEPVAWISACPSVFFAADAAQAGIDLEALPIIRSLNAHTAARAADRLLRSGAFGLLLLDLGHNPQIPMALQGRLLRLAEKHSTALVLLTENPPSAPALSSLVSLRLQATRRFLSNDQRFICELHALKDKQQAPGWQLQETFHGPLGLR